MSRPSFRVFLGAPTKAGIKRVPISSFANPETRPQHHWTTTSNLDPGLEAAEISGISSENQLSLSGREPSIPFPTATLAEATTRLSLVYKNVIFDADDLEEAAEDEADSMEIDSILWPPTAPPRDATADMPSFLHSVCPRRSSIHSIKKSYIPTQDETSLDETSTSYNISSTSSVARFPSFSFSLNSLTSLSSIQAYASNNAKAAPRKVNVLLGVLEVEGPETITIKNGPDRGKQVSLLKMILGDDRGGICKLTAWREVAEAWGGSLSRSPGAKRGDIVFLENVMASVSSGSTSSPTLTASPYSRSKLEICYRTLPYTHEDMRLRPDLRLANSDAAVRKVANLVQWIEGVAGLPPGY